MENTNVILCQFIISLRMRNQGKLDEIHINDVQDLFPIAPYPTQLEMARKLYQIINIGKQKAVIVESPTGTGKTYSLLAAALKWLKQNPTYLPSPSSNQGQEQGQEQESTSLPPWIPKAKQGKGKDMLEKKIVEMGELKSIKDKRKKMNIRKKQKKQCDQNQNKKSNDRLKFQDIEDIEDLMDDVNRKSNKNRNYDILPMHTDTESSQCLPKIIFISRTHSQLSQVMQAIEKIPLIAVKSVTLASKDHLCVHPQLEKNRVQEKCQYLFNHGGCPYYYDEGYHQFFNLQTLADGKELGTKHSVCPYYGIKKIMPYTQILCLPYTSILSEQIRAKLSININNSLLIFDEAHNLLEQELAMKSPQISYQDLSLLVRRVDEYKGKYEKKMKRVNVRVLEHMIEIGRAMMNVIQGEGEGKQESENGYVRMSKMELFLKMGLKEIELHRMRVYIGLTNFDMKLVHLGENKDGFHLGIFNNFIDFLTRLQTPEEPEPNYPNLKRQIILIKPTPHSSSSPHHPHAHHPDPKGYSIKILTLFSNELQKIIKKTKITILAGGTMEPLSSLTSIFKGIDYQFLKFGHVIKPEQCRVHCVSRLKGDSKAEIKFMYKEMVEAGRITEILSDSFEIIERIVKKKIQLKDEKVFGTVIFIQNYQLLESIKKIIGNSLPIPVFYDSNNPSKNNMETFTKYQQEIKERKNSAILISVMGGRLSEGINFADELARIIVVLGLPYPSLRSAEMIEKMRYLDEKMKRGNVEKMKGFSSGKEVIKMSESEEESGNQYYENCCLKTLNQTIGRGIRHINDHAQIYLIDSRFPSISHKLSNWLTKNINFITEYE